MGIASLLKDAPRGKPIPPLSKKIVEDIIEKTLHAKPDNATEWSCRSLAGVSGVSKAPVQQIWEANNLKPHLGRTFKLSNDKYFIKKLRDVVGLYLNPPEHALIFSVDRKKQIVTHDYKRNGTTTLFAALNILKGEVIGTCVKKHRHQEFLSFLKKN